jgi:hypothetical protein
MIERLIRHGRVAVLYSPGYGAGWSTWCHEDEQMRLSMLFDPQIADIRDRGDADWQEKAKAIALVKYPGAYLGGLTDLAVRWLPVGTQFRVMEQDGNEWIEVDEDIQWTVA